ncbi:MAG: AAA family ATPase [Verrucomicrobia bacterium]|nr:AAA family ATPase [Verrucomicrobiota bacterium]
MSEPNHLLRIDHLYLRNFRCFADCELQLHPALTVIVAENAQGKTALLDALRLSLQDFVTTVGRATQSRGFDRTDIRLNRGEHGVMESQLPTEFRVQGVFDGAPIAWRRVLGKDSLHPRTSTKDTKDIRLAARLLADRPDVNDNRSTDSPTVLPVVAYYGTGRLYDEHHLTRTKRWLAEVSPVRVSAYIDCLSPASSYKSFATWFSQKWDEVGDPRFRAVGYEARPESQLAAVRDAVSTVLKPTGWSTIVWDEGGKFDNLRTHLNGYMALEHPLRGRIPLTRLSDGVRNMVALVGDLAHRCVRLNPAFGEEAAKRTPGIVLIDEVEMHLHPSWQQLVIGLLTTAFPCVQFIVTTHSPQVLTTVKRESIRMLGQGPSGAWIASPPPLETKGVESAAALTDVMGVNPVPPIEEVRWLNDYTALIEGGNHESEQGRQLRSKLDAHYGGRHPVILDCDRPRRRCTN